MLCVCVDSAPTHVSRARRARRAQDEMVQRACISPTSPLLSPLYLQAEMVQRACISPTSPLLSPLYLQAEMVQRAYISPASPL